MRASASPASPAEYGIMKTTIASGWRSLTAPAAPP